VITGSCPATGTSAAAAPEFDSAGTAPLDSGQYRDVDLLGRISAMWPDVAYQAAIQLTKKCVTGLTLTGENRRTSSGPDDDLSRKDLEGRIRKLLHSLRYEVPAEV
jgi:hypothetical protein